LWMGSANLVFHYVTLETVATFSTDIGLDLSKEF
jgi:hypothetical protein